MTISRPRAFRFSALALAVVLAAAGGYAVFGPGAQTPAHAQQAAPAAPVDVAPVVSRPIIDWQRYSGRLEAIDRVDIRPLVSGTLTQVYFKDGALVKKGDPLFTIDPRPYEAEVERAEARAAYTASDLARAKRLLAENAIARRDYDQKESDARDAAAALKTARINLGYTRIAAPIDGRVSRAEVTVGNVVSAGASSAAGLGIASTASRQSSSACAWAASASLTSAASVFVRASRAAFSSPDALGICLPSCFCSARSCSKSTIAVRRAWSAATARSIVSPDSPRFSWALRRRSGSSRRSRRSITPRA